MTCWKKKLHLCSNYFKHKEEMWSMRLLWSIFFIWCNNLFQMIKPIFPLLLFLCVSLSVSPQYKKHRLSLGHTNNYAKSVVNMADMVRSLSILSLKRLPQALSVLSLSTHFSLNQPPILHLKHFLGRGMLWAAIEQSWGVWYVGETVTALQQNWGRLLGRFTSGSPVMVLCCWNLS